MEVAMQIHMRDNRALPVESEAPEHHTLIASDRVEGTLVRRPDGEKVGTIQRLMIDKVSGQVAYAVLKFGGFLGIRQKHLPVPWASLAYDRALGAYRLNLSDAELAWAPAFTDDEEFDWGDRSREIEVHSFYRVPPYWGAF
jgi:PRC-barrel domain protein